MSRSPHRSHFTAQTAQLPPRVYHVLTQLHFRTICPFQEHHYMTKISLHHLNAQRAELRGQLKQLSAQSPLLGQGMLMVQMDNYTLNQLALQVIPSPMSIQHST